MRVGVDVDGVLAAFNESFIERVIDITGRDLFPSRPFDITTWNYPESYGYTADEVSEVWADIKADRSFWHCIPAYPDTLKALHYLADRAHYGDDVYFITARPGVNAKEQTERWIADRCPWMRPTVLISSHKGLCAQALNLDVYIDDRWENCLETASMHWKGAAPTCRTYLMNRPWNQENDASAHGIIRTDRVVGICEGLTAEKAAA